MVGRRRPARGKAPPSSLQADAGSSSEADGTIVTDDTSSLVSDFTKALRDYCGMYELDLSSGLSLSTRELNDEMQFDLGAPCFASIVLAIQPLLHHKSG